MRIFRGFDRLPPFRRPAVTVGAYDGVHRGHRALLDRLVAEARAAGGESVVVTFDPHPRVTLGRAEGLLLLTTLEEKLALLAEAGVDNVVVIPFDKEFSALSGGEFLRDYLVGRVGAETLVVGYDHRFGHDRIDCTELPDTGLRIVRVDECDVAGEHVSSTVIRRLLAAGRRAEAERLLGHPAGEAAIRAAAGKAGIPERAEETGKNGDSGLAEAAGTCRNSGDTGTAEKAGNTGKAEGIGDAGGAGSKR